MIKVIELDIDPSLTADTGVWEVALVEYPAIEQELIYFGRQKFYKATEEVSRVACQAIKENEKRGNPAATQVGKVRAQQLCKRDEISLETIKRMYSYLERAKTYNTDNWDDNGTISWKLWGGQPALDWSKRILNSIENQEQRENFVNSAKGFSVGDYVSWTFGGRSEGDDRARGQIKEIRTQGKVQVPGTDYELTASDDRPVALIETRTSKVVGQYIENLRKIKKPEDFVYPNPGENKDEFISRCIAKVINEGKTADQAAGQCYGMWEQNFSGEKVSFDYDDTLTTRKGISILEQERLRGNIIYIITARNRVNESIYELAREYDIPSNRIFAVGSNNEKVNKVLELGIKRHYDNNQQVKNQLQGIASENFDYDVSSLPAYANYPESGDTQAMLVKPFLMETECDCNVKFASYPWDECISDRLDEGKSQDAANRICGWIKANYQKQEFSLLGYIDGEPVFATEQEAEEYGKNEKGCSGSHKHVDKDGNEVYMACEMHPNMDDDISSKGGNIVAENIEIKSIGAEQNIEAFALTEYSPEEIESYGYLQFLKETDQIAFERVIGTLRGASETEIKRRNHKVPTTYFKYERILSGEPTRDFCDSIEGRYFRRLEIDLLRDTNLQFGHKQQPYSKWLYKGGPQCIHAWVKYIIQGENLINQGPVSGTPGIPPKQLPNNGYYSPETKRKSEVAYIVSQQNMSKDIKLELQGELQPVDWDGNYPLYYDPLIAADASYLMGCGGIYDSYQKDGKSYYRACATGMSKAEKQEQVFKADEEKKMIYTPLMIPNILIPRLDETTGERYWVKFTPETIAKIQQKFMIEQRLRETNYEHTEKKFKDVVMVESWIVGAGQDKAYTLGFNKGQIPFGTWMAGYKVLDTDEGNEIWNKYIKTGKVKGASVEGNFLLNFSQQKFDMYLLKEIINILNKIE